MFFGHSFGQNPPPGSQAASNLRHRCEKYTKTNGFCVSYFSQKFSKGRNQYPHKRGKAGFADPHMRALSKN